MLSPPVPAYVEKLCALQDAGLLTPGLHRVLVFHDDWCAIYAASPGVCNCDVEIEIIALDAPQETA